MAARNGKEHGDAWTISTRPIERGAVGLERKSRIMHAEEKQRVAYHEAGHALVACSLPNTHPVHKISIIPRGVGALGYVLSRPDEDRYLITQSELESRIKVALGGTLAEELIFREISNGATSDLETSQPHRPQHGQGIRHEPAGPGQFPGCSGGAFLQSAGMEGERSYSERTVHQIDQEVKRILDESTSEAARFLAGRRSVLEGIARRLIEKEVMDGAELRQMLEASTPGLRLVSGSDVVRPMRWMWCRRDRRLHAFRNRANA